MRPDIFPRVDRKDPLLLSLAEEGRKFEQYCRFKHYTDGIQIGNAGGDNEYDLEEMIDQTGSLLVNPATETATILEGAIRYQNFLIRPDVLQIQRPNKDKKTTLSLIEIKAKSWDSSSSSVTGAHHPMVGKRGGIKSTYLPYLQDVAFQKWVLQMALSSDQQMQLNDIRSYLLLPDKSKTTHINGLNQYVTNVMLNNDNTMKKELSSSDLNLDIDEEDLTALIDVTDLVNRIIYDEKLTFPGSHKVDSNESQSSQFISAAMEWADAIAGSQNNEFTSPTVLLNPPPIGLHCKKCEYRLCQQHDNTNDGGTDDSGFETCWKAASNVKEITTRASADLVIDLWYGKEKDVAKHIANGKYLLSDLTHEDLGFTKDGIELKKKEGKKKAMTKKKNPKPQREKAEDSELAKSGLSRSRRQLFQATGLPANNNNMREPLSDSSSSFFLDEEYLKEEMSHWKYPYHFIDFETAAPVLPYFARMKPFQTIAFQFSHHVLYENGRVEHLSEFLHVEPDGECPNIYFLNKLADSIGNCDGSVFRWGIHENTVLSFLLKQDYDVSDDETLAVVKGKLSPLLIGEGRGMIDLMNVATLAYFVSGSDASSSIKKLVLPTLEVSSYLEDYYGSPTYTSTNFSNMQWYSKNIITGKVRDPYDLLSRGEQGNNTIVNGIADGGSAIAAYNSIQCDASLSLDKIEAIKKHLLRYCELDTLAMVMMIQAWQGFLSTDMD